MRKRRMPHQETTVVPKRRRSGRTQPEAKRARGQVLLRLAPVELEELDYVASRLRLSRSDAVVELVRTWLGYDAHARSCDIDG